MTLLKYSIPLLALLLAWAPLSAQAQKAPSVIRDEEIERTLEIFAAPVLKQAGLSPDTVRFVLVEDDTLNAFVAGGQNIFLHTGLLLKTKNSDEIVGVIAHESGHIALGHLFRRKEEMESLSFESMLVSLFSIAAAFGTGKAEVGIAGVQVGQNIALRQFLRHNRTQEGAADQAGVKFLHRAGLPVSGFLSFMEQLENQELLPESEQSQYVLTHPLTADRVDFLRTVTAEEKNKKTPPEWDERHARLKAKLLGYLFPDRALQDRSEDVAARYGRAIAYYRQNKFDKSLGLLDPLLKEEPQNPWFYELKGQMLFERGRIADSLPAYEKAITYAPDAGLIRAAYGHALMEAGDKNLGRAVEQFTLSLKTEPRAPGTHRFLAIAYGKLGQEGLSRLHLAEAALLKNDLATAKLEAVRAKALLQKSAPARQRAEDILAIAEKKAKKRR